LLAQIVAPTLIITAADDSIIPVSMFESASFSPAVKLVVTARGGHVGFYAAKSSDPDRWWIDWRIIDWMHSAAATHDNRGEHEPCQ